MKTETGVMVVKDGKAWGVTYDDGYSTGYGWVDLVEAQLYNPAYCKRPEDTTFKGSFYVKELQTGRLVPVKRVTVVTLLDNSLVF